MIKIDIVSCAVVCILYYLEFSVILFGFCVPPCICVLFNALCNISFVLAIKPFGFYIFPSLFCVVSYVFLS